ncbi:MAG: serine/threonine protein kinase [Phycisphaerae bacterium]|nr:serine/threonine protein kinase [Phycisphaerae bacterium]
MDIAHIQPPRIPGWEVVSQIGRGGGSIIYEVRDSKTGETCALKYVSKEMTKGSRFFEQVEAEHRLGEKVTHPNLRKTLRLRKRGILATQELYLWMELVQGRPLSRRGNDFSRPLLALLKAADGLRAIHRMRYIHADFNPKNVMISDEGGVKLIDYGQSCPLGTRKKRVQGTLEFLAPEQATKGILDHRTDIFNFGATLYWALTGQTIGLPLPEQKGNRRPGSRNIAPPSVVNVRVSKELEAIIMGCLAESPGDRPESLDAILGDLHVELRECLLTSS